MKPISEYRKIARDSLKNKWGIAVLACLLIALIDSALASLKFASILSILITGPLTVGAIIFFENMIENKKATIEDLFKNSFENFVSNMCAFLLKSVYILLWSLLFIIPGIVKSYSYSLTMYIKSKQPELEAEQAIALSKELMNGHKLRLFLLQLSFIGWGLLCVLSLGIGFLFLQPYITASEVAFLKEIYENSPQTQKTNVNVDNKQNEVEIEIIENN